MKPLILGIESSCDDTAVAIIHGKTVLSNIVCNQKIHEKYGGVVPELASRAHQKNIIPTIDQAIKSSNIKLNELNAIAFTKNPGLTGSLMVGESFAKSLALALKIPIIEVNHIEAHILSHFIKHPNHKTPQFPFICLTISGGHTQITIVQDYFIIKILGETLDDAVGETIDKIGRMLGLKYPSGKIIDELSKKGDPMKFKFTTPKVSSLSFSFSGIKTSFLFFLKRNIEKNSNFIRDNLEDICASIQHHIVNILINKIHICIKKTGINRIALSGGVSSNSYLRNKIIFFCKKYNYECFLLDLQFTTDNGAMIALVGTIKYLNFNNI